MSGGAATATHFAELESRWVHRAPLVAAVGALVATAGDFGQLWCANAGRPEIQLPAPPPSLIAIATLAGAFAIPLYGLGYRARAREMSALAPRRALAVSVFGVAFAIIGGTVHATTGTLISLRAGQIADGLDPLQGILASGPIVLTLWLIATFLFLIAGASEAALPQAPARRLANPILLTLAFTGLGLSLPLPWRDFLAPAALNIAHGALFTSLVRFRSV